MRILFKVLKIFVVILLLTVVSFSIFAPQYWRTGFSADEMKGFAEIVKGSKDLSHNFYPVYDRLYPNQRKVYLGNSFFRSVMALFQDKSIYELYDCPCGDVYPILVQDKKVLPQKHADWKAEYKAFWFGFGLQKYVSSEKCFDFVYGHSKDFRSKDLWDLTVQHFGKNLEDLSKKEVVELILLVQSPILYNKKRNPAVFNRKFEEVWKMVEDEL